MQIKSFFLWNLVSKIPEKIGYILVISMVLAAPVYLSAAGDPSTTTSVQQQIAISGTITDETGEPMPGVSVAVKGTTIGMASNSDGKFSINVPSEGSVLTFSYLGFVKQEITVGRNRILNIKMVEDTQQLGELVVVGYGNQKKETITGAVVAVQSKELLNTKNTNIQNMLTGKLPGVRNIQKTAEPGVFNNQFDIRGLGSPLMVVDGVPRGDFFRLDPNDIETISVLKDASAAVYGMRAANGVILITTKSGEKGTAKIEYSGYYGIQVPAEILRPNNTHDRGMLFSENLMRGSRSSPNRGRYNDAWFESLARGEINDTDWYGAALKGSAPQQQHNISARGGSEKMDYFINFGFTNQQSFWTTNASNYDRYNLRANINAYITNRLKAGLRLNMITDRTKRQRQGTNELFKCLWRHIPEDPLYANNNPQYLFNGYADHGNILAVIDPELSGFIDNKRNIIQSNMSLEYTFPVKGLKGEFLYSYDMSFNDNTEYQKQYSTYHYDAANDVYIMSGLYPATKTNLNRSYRNDNSRMWNVRLKYDNLFLNMHRVNALLLYEERYSQNYDFRALRYYDIPIPYLFAGNTEGQIGSGSGLDENANRAVVGRLNYEFNGKYLTEFSFRYDGSSRFPKGKQWGFFPSVQIGYRISEESFIKNNLSFISNMKLRATWGQTGDDSTGSYQFVEGYDYPATGGGANTLPNGAVFGTTFVNAVGFRNAPNPDITWMKATMKNIGLDADFQRDIIGFSFDLFQRDLSDILTNPVRNIPNTFGTGMSQANLNARTTKGLEIELRHKNRFNDFRYLVKGFVQLTRSTWTKRDQTERSNSYDNWRNNLVGRWNDVWFGKASNGVYQNWEQIENSPFATVGTLPGDPIYVDWNGDGIINTDDDHPIAITTSSDANTLPSNNPLNERNYPLMNFGISLDGSWKYFDFNVLFQGAAMSYVGYVEQLASALAWNGNGLALHMDRWYPADPNANPWDPTIQWVKGYYPYGNNRAELYSEFNIQKGDYLRLKSAEIGFTVPKNMVVDKLGVKNLRFFVNSYNLLTFTGVRGLDPEHPSETYGYLYPLNRTFNFGGTITF